ncbi:MAG: glutaredoxin family protein [Chloroflexi bacterium]|nr:MAG: glutaredoxin family protein [Chloroflexota bacterium]
MEFLSRHGVVFTNKNIREDPVALQEVIATGSTSTPTTIIDGQLIIGFDQRRLKELLNL